MVPPCTWPSLIATNTGAPDSIPEPTANEPLAPVSREILKLPESSTAAARAAALSDEYVATNFSLRLGGEPDLGYIAAAAIAAVAAGRMAAPTARRNSSARS